MINLKYWLAKQNMSAIELSKASGVNYDTVRFIAKGKVKNPNPKTINKLAVGLNIGLEQLISKEE